MRCGKMFVNFLFNLFIDRCLLCVFLQLEQAEETTERRKILECEKISTEELQLRYKVF